MITKRICRIVIVGISVLFPISLFGETELYRTPIQGAINSWNIDSEGYFNWGENTDILEIPGLLALPIQRFQILLPEDVIDSSIEISFENEHYSPIATNARIRTSQIPQNYHGELASSEMVQNPIVHSSIGKMRSYTIASAVVRLVKHNPVTSTSERMTGGELVVKYSRSGAARLSESEPQAFSNILNEIVTHRVDNGQTRMSEPDRKASTYAVLMPEALKSSLKEFNGFIRTKELQGFTVKVFTEKDWNGPSAKGNVHTVRAWLAGIYKQENISHVLIIDHPETGAVPMLKTWIDFSGSYQPLVDYYYSDLSGNWDKDKDGKYGTFGYNGGKDMGAGGADGLPEVFVGRIPYYGNATDVDRILKRTADYARESATSAVWRKKAYLPMNDFGPGAGDGANYGNKIITDIVKKESGWTSSSLFGTATSVSGVLSGWNSGKAGVTIWQAHGLVDYAEKILTTSDASQLNSSYPSIVFQTSCHNSKPESASNLAFAVLKNNAISTVAFAVQCLYNASQTSWDKKADARSFGYTYAKNIINGKLPAGEALGKTRSSLAVEHSTDWLNLAETNLYGCPAVGIATFGITDNVGISKSIHGVNQAVKTSVVNGKVVLHGLRGGVNSISLYKMNGTKVSEIAVNPEMQQVVMDGLFSNGHYVLVVNFEGNAHQRSISKITIK